MKDQCVLYNTENYKSTIHNTSQDILAKISTIIIEYMRLISEKINIKNKQYYIFIFERGIETLIHVFSMIFSLILFLISSLLLSVGIILKVDEF